MTDQGQSPSSAAALRDVKREMLARLLASEGLGGRDRPVEPRAAGTHPPLSFAQEVIWLLDQATPGLTAYNSVLAFELGGSIDVPRIEGALDALVARHEALRTRFESGPDGPVQIVDVASPAGLTVEDLRGLPFESRPAEAERRIRNHARRAFDLARDHLFRPVLILLTDQSSELLLVTHHIVSDAWSYGILLRELSQLYRAEGPNAELPALPIQFGDFAVWERREMAGERLRNRIGYWRDNLTPPAPPLALPTDRPRAAAPSFEGGRAALMLPPSLLGAVKALALSEGATLYMVLLAAYQVLLHRWSGQSDVVTGSAIAGRTRSETEGVVGYFSGALPLRTRFIPGDSFRSVLHRVRTTVLGALEHSNVPIEALAGELQQGGRSGHAPLFQAVLTMQETVGTGLDLRGITARALEVETGTTKFDLTLLPAERGEHLELLLWYRADLFGPESAQRFLGHFATLLAAAVADPELAVSALPLLTEPERVELGEFNRTARDLGQPTTLTQLIQRAAARRTTETAVVSGERTLSWNELTAHSHRLARRLQTLGVGPDVPVGLCFERSVALIVGMHGILAAGGGYVPLLPDLPAARLATQLVASGARIVVTNDEHRGRFPSDVTLVILDADGSGPGDSPDTPLSTEVGPEHLAYVLFTSGSTGVPKGVRVSHGNMVHYTRAVSAVLGLDLDGEERWHFASISTLAADLGHTSVFPALASGGVLHILESGLVTDASRFQAYLAEHPIDVLKITPSHFQALAGPEFAEVHLPRRWLVLGGEPLPWTLVERVLSRGRCRVLNHYGPTEATVGATTFEIGTRDVSAWAPATVPVGRPLPNVTADILDPNGELVPIGIPGELWIGGSGVASGYIGNSELTSERFVLSGAGRRYRTGDQVRRLSTGDLEFLGRLDQQVKIRGHRVELGEIETVLGRHESVRQAAVALQDDRLIGYVVPATRVEDSVLGAHVAALLPDYMVPTVWCRLDALPLNANGKIDRKALPVPATAAAAENGPLSDLERRLADVWAEILKRPSIGIHDNFFALGGHSLLAIRLLGRIAKTFGPRLSLRTLFEHPTVASLARELTPRDPVETALALLWADVLKTERVDRDANFFALGGHSLLAIRLLGRVAKQFGVRLPLRTLFEQPTVAGLAAALVAAGAGPERTP